MKLRRGQGPAKTRNRVSVWKEQVCSVSLDSKAGARFWCKMRLRVRPGQAMEGLNVPIKNTEFILHDGGRY